MQMKARGKFIGDKIDLLVSYLNVHPFLRLYSRLPQKLKARAHLYHAPYERC